jgi:uncharacterized protein (TIGR03437 family)
MSATKLSTMYKQFRVVHVNSACLRVLSVLIAVLCSAQAQTPPLRPPGIVLVNAASMAEITSVAPGSLITIFGVFKTQNNAAFSATTTPLPETLGGLTVRLNTTTCLLSYVSPTQINLYIPETVKGLLSTYQSYPLTVTDTVPQTFTRQVGVIGTTPGIFTVQSNGQGTAVGQITNGANVPTNIYNPDGSPKELEVTTDGKQNYLTLYGTGFRSASTTTPNDANGVAEVFQATIQGVAADLTFVGAQGQYTGLDQINIKLPPQSAGLGVVKIRIGYAGLSFYNDLTNPVTCKMGGAPPAITARIVPDGLLPFDGTGELTTSSQVMKSAAGNIYFFDAWRYKATQKGTSITLRSTIYAPLMLIYKIGADKSLQFVSASANTYDTTFGGISIGGRLTSPQLLVTALPEVGEYLIFVTSGDSYPETTGQYQFTLNTKVTELNAANLPLTQSGKFDSTDLTTTNGTPLDAYWWAGNKGDKLEFEATSSAFRPALWIVKADGTTITAAESLLDTTPGTIRLAATLPETGNYLLVATSRSQYLLGAYSLTMRRVTSFSDSAVEADHSASPANLMEKQKQIDRLGARRIVLLDEPKQEP